MFQTLGPGPVPKRFHKKSKRGCKECKRRKVKCDERKPVCGNCERHFDGITDCEWVDASTVAGSSSVARLNRPSQPRSSSDDSASACPTEVVDVIRSTAIELQSVRGAVSPASPLRRTIRGEMLDPFDTHPESTVPDADELMKHYFSRVVFQTFPWQPESEKNPVTKFYTPLIWTDSVMFHATLQLSAFRLENRMSQRRGTSKRLMGECIRLLNNRVQDPLLSISDQTIGAVATLATVEYENGNMRLLRMHLEGLKQMCKMRGGLAAIRASNPMLANMVFWTFVMAMTETPHLQLDPDDILDTPNWLYDARASFIQTTTNQLDLPAYGVNENISSIAFDVNCLSQRFIKHSDYTTVEECLSALTFICNTLQRLLSLPTLLPSPNPSEACRIATALHIMTPWRGLRPDPILVINDLLHKLKACLVPLLSSESNELLLWLLFTGGVSALGTPERLWFVSHLVTMVGDLDLEEWDDVKYCLRRVIWHEILCGRSYRKLWEEVRVEKENLDGIAFP